MKVEIHIYQCDENGKSGNNKSGKSENNKTKDRRQTNMMRYVRKYVSS